jgi:cytochrome c biogenesis protein CcmG/thiol:disulfide interchange protein DsbE
MDEFMKRNLSPLVILSLGSMAMTAGAANLEVGKPFPALSLPSVEDGAPVSVADYRGEKLLVHIFASW